MDTSVSLDNVNRYKVVHVIAHVPVDLGVLHKGIVLSHVQATPTVNNFMSVRVVAVSLRTRRVTRRLPAAVPTNVTNHNKSVMCIVMPTTEIESARRTTPVKVELVSPKNVGPTRSVLLGTLVSQVLVRSRVERILIVRMVISARVESVSLVVVRMPDVVDMLARLEAQNHAVTRAVRITLLAQKATCVWLISV